MSSLILNSDIIASSYKNNSLPLEEQSDNKVVFLTKGTTGYCLKILEFGPPLGQWLIKGNLDLPEDSCAQHLPSNPEKYVFSLAFFDNLDDPETPRFFVFLGYGSKIESSYHEIWYFVFDLDNSDYRCLNCGQFDNILSENGFETQYFRSFTVAPKGQNGICRLAVGYRQRFEENHDINSKSGFKVGYVTYDNDDLTYVRDYVPPELRTRYAGDDYYPKPIGYMGVKERDNTHDLIILVPGYVFPQDDVLFVHELGDAENIVRRSWGLECLPLLDHPAYFCKILFNDGNGTQKNIGVVRDVQESNGSSFVRYVVELDPDVTDSFVDYKMVLDASPLEPNIPSECKLFHMDSGDLSNNTSGNDDLVIIWKECEDCSEGFYVLKITGISPTPEPQNCEDIDFAYSFVPEFKKGPDHINDLNEPMYIRYTVKDGGYFLSLFYHDVDQGISVHVEEYDF